MSIWAVPSLPAARRCERRAGSDEAEWQQLIAQHTSVMLYPSSSTSQNCARTDGHTGLPIGVTCFSNMHSMLQMFSSMCCSTIFA